MSTSTVEIDADLGIDQPYHVVSMRLTERISEPTRAELELASTEELSLEPVLSGPVELALLFDGLPQRIWRLKAGRAAFLGARLGTLRYAVELYAPIWFLRFTMDTRKFRDVSAEQIVRTILGEHSVPFRFALTRATAPRSYCVQYRETCLAFVERLLEFEGIYYTLDEDGTLVMADRSPASPPVDGPSDFELIDASGALDRDALGIHAFQRGVKVASGRATLNDFDWKHPRRSLLTDARADRDAELEIYDYPSGYRDPGVGAMLAAMRLEALRAPARYATGAGNVPSFAPARLFTFGAAGGAAFAGEHLLVEVTHELHDPRYDDGDGSTAPDLTYENRFEAIPSDVPFRPPLKTPRPTIAGCHTAMVRGPAGAEIHTDVYGRFKAQFHWDREAQGLDDSRWLRTLQESATSMVLARVGWEMTVGYIDGDPDRPLGLARNINGVMIPAYAQPGNKNLMTIKTPTSPATGGYNEIKLDDSAGFMGFYVRAERDLTTVVKHDKTERVGNNEMRRIDQSTDQAVERHQTINIGADLLTQSGADHRLEVKGSRTRTVGGSETVSSGSDINVTTQGNETESVGSVRLTISGSVKPPNLKKMLKSSIPTPPSPKAIAGGGGSLKSMIPSPKGALSGATGGLSEGVSMAKLVDLLCHGDITRDTEQKMSRTVGGALLQVSVRNITTQAKDLYAETVGGVKLTVSGKGNISSTSTDNAALTVGGAVLRKSAKDMGIGSKSTSVTVGGAAVMTSDEQIEIRGNHIVLEARAGLTLKSPSLEIALSPSKITMKGKVKLESEKKVVVTGMDDNLT